jgi:hypothetical protein
MGGRGRKALAGVGLSLALTTMSIAVTTTASADVLVSALQPTTLKCGAPVDVGIWYQSFSGGPRWARITIRARSGQLVWRKEATARTTWRRWYVYTLCDQHYVLTYTTAGGTSRFPFYVRSPS